MDKLTQVSMKVQSKLIYVSGIIVLVLCLYTTADVGGRYLLNKPMWAAYEVTLILLIYITFWGIGYAQARNGHMRLEFLWDKFGPRGRLVLDIISVSIGIFLFAIITWQSWEWAVHSWVIQETTMGAYIVPLIPARIGIVIGSFIVLVQYVINLIVYIGQLLTGKEVTAR
jgi:TRAP-type C4-dicarboxylate transport system permease small subunit